MCRITPTLLFFKIINENKLGMCCRVHCKCALVIRLRVNKIKLSSEQVAGFIDKVKSVRKIAASPLYVKKG